MSTARLATAVRLARWLGPWTAGDAVPSAIVRDERSIAPSVQGERPLRAWRYRPAHRAPTGALLLLHGLHFLGPSDPRMDRFARILAASGMLVLAPFLPDFEALVLAPAVLRDAERALDALLDEPARPQGLAPGVMSISFGSLPALHLASTLETSRKISTAVLFGGYADLGDTLRFCVSGAEGAPHDPLNRAVVFMNLVEHLTDDTEEQRALMRAWRAFVHETWGRPELKQFSRAIPFARAIAATLDEPARSLFLRTVGVEPGAEALLDEALSRGASALAWLEPAPRAREVRVATHVVHGADDDVIPHTHASRLGELLAERARAGVHVTGLYGHTGASGAPWSDAARLAREARTLVGALDAIARAGGAR